ncbi:MAG: hypothetical protein FWD90_11645 [Defluviitaleaceae bacterium]|nr:hypothetical protein [Defluviitaleaceae bacterium]
MVKPYEPMPDGDVLLIRDNQPPSNGDANGEMMLIESFLRDAGKAMPLFEEIYNGDEGNAERFLVSIHGMKSSLAIIGENDLSNVAYEMEKAGRQGSTDLISCMMPPFYDNMLTLMEKLNKKLAEHRAQEDEAVSVTNDMTAIKTRLHGKHAEGIDIAKGLARYGGNEETYILILRSYAAGVRSMLGTVENVNQKTLTDYEIKVHAIKGMSLDIYANHIGYAAADLENAAKDKNLGFIDKHNAAFLESVKKLITELENLLRVLDEENPKTLKAKPDEAALKKLLAACQSYNMDDADAAMAEIDRYRYDDDGGLALWLTDRYDIMDYNSIVKRLGGES